MRKDELPPDIMPSGLRHFPDDVRRAYLKTVLIKRFIELLADGVVQEAMTMEQAVELIEHFTRVATSG